MAKLPTAEEVAAQTAALQPYFLALGKVAHSWNHLHEELGKVFCAVTGLPLHLGMGVWHKLKSDRSQRDILEGAIQSRAVEDEWAENNPNALKGVTDLLHQVQSLANKRNDAIHAPCLVISGIMYDFEIAPMTFFGNKLAKNLHGKDILKEFEWYEKTADVLRDHAWRVRFALDSHGPWPNKPQLPSLGQDHSRDP